MVMVVMVFFVVRVVLSKVRTATGHYIETVAQDGIRRNFRHGCRTCRRHLIQTRLL